MRNVGVDIGGTNIAIGVLDEGLRIIAQDSVPFPHSGGEAVAALIAGRIRALLGGAVPGSIGVAVPGSIDSTGECVLHAYNLGFHDEPLRARIQAHFPGVPVLLANDANAAALAELHKGAFTGCATAMLLTIGTGIGGGLILGGRMFNGGRNRGVEPGHAILVDGGEPCTCGVNGCIEAYVSATALIRQANRAALAHPGSLLNTLSGGDPAKMTAKLAIDCAKAGDDAASRVFSAYVRHLGSAVAVFINTLDPEVVAIGGGVSHAGEFLFAPLRADVDGKCFLADHGRVVPAALGNEAGVVGAAMLWHNAR